MVWKTEWRSDLKILAEKGSDSFQLWGNKGNWKYNSVSDTYWKETGLNPLTLRSNLSFSLLSTVQFS